MLTPVTTWDIYFSQGHIGKTCDSPVCGVCVSADSLRGACSASGQFLKKAGY